MMGRFRVTGRGNDVMSSRTNQPNKRMKLSTTLSAATFIVFFLSTKKRVTVDSSTSDF